MAVDTNFASLFENLKLEDPWLPPRPWESIPSESGPSHFDTSTPPSSLSTSLYDTSTVSEASLVRLAMNALHGVESAIVSIEKLCAAFCSDPADRTFYRIPSLWNRSLSTHALGNILKSIGRFGFIVFLLRKFVDYFTNLNFGGYFVGNKLENSELVENLDDHGNEVEERLPYSLVNQAFSVAVGKVLEGYICALDTLYTSVSLRRLPKAVDASSHSSSGVGCLTSVVHSEITLLEVYLHTKELRTQIGALGNICNIHDVALCFSISSFEDLVAKANLEFCNFPRGGDLLSCLYTQLRVADPVHCALLKFLFLRSCEPYCEFIRSWIYKAKISDPYKEFIVEYIDNPPSYSPATTGISIDFPLATIREQDGVAFPCFLKDYLIPLLRAGQQLQVLTKLLELCNHVGTGSCSYADILPCWSDFSSTCPSYASPMTFNKGSIEAMVVARNNYYKMMLKKLESLLEKLEIKQVILQGNVPVFVDDSRGSLNTPFSFTTDDNLISPSADRRDSDAAVDTVDSEGSSTMDDFSYLEDQLKSSECSSLNSSEEQNESEQLIQFPNGLFGPEQKYLSTLNFLPSIPVSNSLQKPSQSDVSLPVESDSRKICERISPPDHFLYFQHEGTNLSNNSLPLESEESNLSLMFETQYTGSQHDMGWLLSGSVKSHSYVVDRESRDDPSLHQFECGLKVSKRNMGVLKEDLSYFSSTILNALKEEATDKGQLPNGPRASSHSFILQPWKLKYHSNFLSMNPTLTQNDLMSKPTERFCRGHREHFSCFDFSSVKDPCKVYMENLAAKHRHQFRPELTIFKNSGAPAATVISNYHVKEGYDGDEVLIDKSTLPYVNPHMESKDNKHEDVSLANVSGGNGWESILGCSPNTINSSVGDQRKSLAAIFEIPLDFVIKKCLLEEILLQYVSKLTIKLLEEGFDLQEHLLALRRYHFMEFADWADLFIMALWHHKWYATEADQRISEIQGLLELSVQRSSCERDHNKDRLFVYTKGHGMMPLSTSAIGVHSFDFLGLGYRVDWPISIILTPGALKIYSEIFSFLIQVKLAVFSLTDVWCSLKDLLHLIKRHRHSELHKLEVHHFYILTKLRHQINHFVSTLQQYVQSQLSHVSWCRFLYSLKHKVKDMMDLESVHMAYITDSLHICFLSNDTRPIASIVESILQCALDFRSCLIGGTCNARLDGSLLCELSRINISQVLVIKGTFDRNLKELHLCYLKSPKHGEFGLSHFWGYLNYNEYYSDVTNEISHYAFSV